jgi:hypothetical protein
MKKWRVGSLISGINGEKRVYEICHPRTLSNGKKVIHYQTIEATFEYGIESLPRSEVDDVTHLVETGHVTVLSY